MKIYNKSAFTFGVLCAGGLSLFALGIISATWWQWVVTIVISCRYLYVGLSKTASAHVEAIHQHYNEVVIQFFGKYAFIKINLPIIFLVAFFGVALFIRFAFDIVTPASVAIIFCILLMVSVVYTIGLDRNIQNTIENEMECVQ